MKNNYQYQRFQFMEELIRYVNETPGLEVKHITFGDPLYKNKFYLVYTINELSKNFIIQAQNSALTNAEIVKVLLQDEETKKIILDSLEVVPKELILDKIMDLTSYYTGLEIGCKNLNNEDKIPQELKIAELKTIIKTLRSLLE